MAAFLSTTNTFLHPNLPSSPSSSSSPTFIFPKRDTNGRKPLTLCKSSSESPPPSLSLNKRSFSLSLISGSALFWAGGSFPEAIAAILEADDDVELLEKVKEDRKKRLERQSIISSSNKEKGYLQDLVYKLSKVGQAIEDNDLPKASLVLGQGTDADWVQKANAALTKLSNDTQEKTEVDVFNSSIASLISSVSQNDVKSSKTAFVASASSFEKWTTLTGLGGQLKGL